MAYRALAAAAGISWLVFGGIAQAQQAAQAPMQERPTAAAQSSRRDAPDEPLQQSGPVVERRSTRGAQAQESKLADSDVATAPIREVAVPSTTASASAAAPSPTPRRTCRRPCGRTRT
jgi:hypothetical protein